MTHQEIVEIVNDPKNLPLIEEMVIESMNDATTGLCLSCMQETSVVEPDAEHYTCPSCDKTSVFGGEQLILYVV